MDIQSVLWAVVVLLIVLGLIAASARIARALGLVTGVPGLGKRQRRLQVLEVTAVDSRRRLVLVGRDDRAHLLLLGPTADLVVERDIEGAAPPAVPDEAP